MVEPSTNINDIRKEYKQNKYGKQNVELKAIDEKMVKAIHKLRTRYKQIMEEKKCIVVLDKEPVKANKRRLCTKKDVHNITSKLKETKIKGPSTEKKICSAFKLDGKRCTAGAKPGSDFCGRHRKK